MTLFDIDRLIRRILDILQQPDNPAASQKLAEDFASACHATNLRLQQCEAMLRAGDRQQAIQSAETAPNLLDCVTALEFRSADQWRSYCQQHGLPAADRIDARSVHALNECYAQGIATDHPLYAAYRKATLSRNDEEALKALQSIVRLNPSDTNAASELARLDSKVLQARLQHLDDALVGSTPETIVADVEAIEAFGFKSKPAGDPWCKAQAIRCGILVSEAEGLRASTRWEEALSKLDIICRLESDHKLALPPHLMERIAQIERWARGEQEKDKRNREFQSLLGKLHHAIHQSEEKDTSARQVKLPEMREDFEALHKTWRTLEDFTRPIPEDAVAAFRKRTSLLEAEIARRTALRRKAVIAGVIATVVIGIAAGWFTLTQLKAREIARQLREAVAQRKVHTAEKLLDAAKAYRGPMTSGGLSAPAAEAETFIAKERGLLGNCEEALAKLPKDLSGNASGPELLKTSAQLAITRASLDALAPDLKAEHEPAVRGFERRWEKFLADNGERFNQSLDQGIAAAEKQCGELDYRLPPEQIRPRLAALSDQISSMADCESGLTNLLRLRGDLLQRAAAARATFAAYDREMKKLDNGYLGLQKARTTAAYSEALAVMASSEFSSAPLTKAASTMQAIGASQETALRLLLGATNAGVWAFLKRGELPRFIPETAFPAEKAIFRELSEDIAVRGPHTRTRLWLDAEGARVVEWITVGPFGGSYGWNKVKAYEVSPASTHCEFSEREYGYFDGKYKLTPTQPIYRLDFIGVCGETAAFGSIGLEKVNGASGYGKPLLEVLDALKDSQESSPLFRAYMLRRLAQIMALQPEAWGLTFAPSISVHRSAIDQITGGQLASGDWFVPSKVGAWAQKIEQLFASAKGVSYAKQATGLLALAREAAKGGLKYVGFVGMDGKTALVEGSTPEETWGYSINGKQPALITRAGTPAGEAMPLSPLFALTVPRNQIIAAAGVDVDAAPFNGILPPLFQAAGAKPNKP